MTKWRKSGLRFRARISQVWNETIRGRSGDLSEIPCVFLVSTGRTGTKFIANYFRKYSPSVYSRHEPEPDFLRLGLDYAANMVTPGEARETIKRGRKTLPYKLSITETNLFLESNNRLFSLIDILDELFDSKYIHIVRDGRNYVRFGMSRGWYTESDRYDRLRAINFPSDPYAGDWEQMSPFEKITWRWQKKDGFICRALDGHPKAKRVYFEDIFSTKKGYPGMRAILDTLNQEPFHVEAMSRKVNQTEDYSIPSWEEWDEATREKFWTIAKDHMKFHGYD